MSTEVPQKDFRRKIKTREQLREAIGSRPRTQSVILCHGTFDLVHPGHLAPLSPIDDIRASAAYRNDAVMVLLRRLLAGLTA